MVNPLQVLYEDNHLLIINKPAGMLVQGDVTGDKPLVDLGKEYIKITYQKPGEVFLGVVHRLDRPVSGVVVFARTSKALERMNALFRDRETLKTYWALVDSMPPKPEGTLVHWLVKDEKKNKTTAYARENAQGQRSELSYKTIESRKGFFLLEVKPITGAPTSNTGCSLLPWAARLLGDLKYGYQKPASDASIGLHARQLEFNHPVKKVPLLVLAEVPKNDLWKPFS
ncbi:MAG: RluA family pseudouridine synthase [Cytophagales bacterium]|nr:RluA family pseudouridine synthase [Cytophagales bacterium]